MDSVSSKLCHKYITNDQRHIYISEVASRSAGCLIQSNQDQDQNPSYARKNHQTRMVELFVNQETDWESSECRHLIKFYFARVNLTEFEYDQKSKLLQAMNANFKKFLEMKGKIETKKVGCFILANHPEASPVFHYNLIGQI